MKNNWTEFLMNPEMLKAIYGEQIPVLKGEVSAFHLNRNGPTAELVLLSRELPEIMPEKWLKKEANAVAFSLHFIDIQSVQLYKFAREGKAEIKFERLSENEFMAKCRGNVSFNIKARFLSLNGLRAYRQEI